MMCVTGDVKFIRFSGLDGNDTFTNNTPINCEAHGGDGNDFLSGGSDSAIDTYYGGAGSDTFMLPAASSGIGGKPIKDYSTGEDMALMYGLWLKYEPLRLQTL